MSRTIAYLLTAALMCVMSAVAHASDVSAEVTPESADKAVSDLNLSKSENAAAARIVDRFRQTQKQAYEAMLAQMKMTLTAEQYQAFERSLGGAAVVDADGSTRVPVTITDGHDTDPRDHGRPVVLVAAGLNVPAEVFRKVFSGVHPAAAGQQPQEADVRQNKRVLLEGLSPYGVDDEKINEVSNYYRYVRSRDGVWRNTPAVVDAVVKNGRVTGFVVINPGAGYSTSPTIVVQGHPEVRTVVTLKFGTDLKTNGSIDTVALVPKGPTKSAE